MGGPRSPSAAAARWAAVLSWPAGNHASAQLACMTWTGVGCVLQCPRTHQGSSCLGCGGLWLCGLFCFPAFCEQVPVSYWGADSGEGEFVFHKGHLLAGCMDKAQFGKFGLVHAMQVCNSW